MLNLWIGDIQRTYITTEIAKSLINLRNGTSLDDEKAHQQFADRVRSIVDKLLQEKP